MQEGPSELLEAYLRTLRHFHDYSRANRLLIALQKPNATFVAGYKKWKQLGRYVKKRRKSHMGLGPYQKED